MSRRERALCRHWLHQVADRSAGDMAAKVVFNKGCMQLLVPLWKIHVIVFAFVYNATFLTRWFRLRFDDAAAAPMLLAIGRCPTCAEVLSSHDKRKDGTIQCTRCQSAWFPAPPLPTTESHVIQSLHIQPVKHRGLLWAIDHRGQRYPLNLDWHDESASPERALSLIEQATFLRARFPHRWRLGAIEIARWALVVPLLILFIPFTVALFLNRHLWYFGFAFLALTGLLVLAFVGLSNLLARRHRMLAVPVCIAFQRCLWCGADLCGVVSTVEGAKTCPECAARWLFPKVDDGAK